MRRPRIRSGAELNFNDGANIAGLLYTEVCRVREQQRLAVRIFGIQNQLPAVDSEFSNKTIT